MQFASFAWLWVKVTWTSGDWSDGYGSVAEDLFDCFSLSYVILWLRLFEEM